MHCGCSTSSVTSPRLIGSLSYENGAWVIVVSDGEHSSTVETRLVRFRVLG